MNIAPEVLDNRFGHSHEADLWALGVIMYTVLVGRAPFETSDLEMTYRKIKRGNFTFPIHVSISNASKDFIRSILTPDPKDRIRLDKIMSHEFFTESYPPLMPPLTLTCPPVSDKIEPSESGKFIKYDNKLSKNLKYEL